MKYFFDTEFIEYEGGIDLVSIGIVCEDGRTFYAENISFNPSLADKWVEENVLSKLIYYRDHPQGNYSASPKHFKTFATVQIIKTFLQKWIKEDKGDNPEFYAYYADYDWVVFCKIFGRMINLPAGYPMFCIDLKQMMWERGLDTDWKRKNCPEPTNEHNALVDAKWNLELYNKIKLTDKN